MANDPDTTDSRLAHNGLLKTVQYPESSGGADVVTYAYNTQGETIYTKDQAGTEHQYDYDTAGRRTQDRVTAFGTGVNQDVKRVAWAFDSLSRVTTVTTYDNAAVGSGTVQDEVKHTYHDWGPASKIEQDHDSTVGGSGVSDYEVEYAWADGTGNGRRSLLCESMTLPDGTVVDYQYVSAGSRFDDDLGRVTRVKYGTTQVAEYKYLGVGHVVHTELPEPAVFSQVASSTQGSYPGLDRFNRVVASTWTKDLATDKDFYSLTLTYGTGANNAADLLRVEDTILTTADNDAFGRWDWLYTSDMVSRLKNAERGNWSGNAIDNDRATQNWTLTQTGNWDLWQSDEDGDGNFTDAGEFNDDRTHNDANEIIDRDTDDNGTANHAFTHDAAGNTTDDGQYEYEYDAWNRLTKVFNGGVGDWAGKKYRYNGLGWRITAINDTDADGSFDDETAEHYVYDSKWRIVARYNGSDSTPKEQWAHHNAGLDGRGGSSYIDAVILRQRDATGDATLEERRYYCQNWRADVVCLLKESGVQVERVSYDPYGEAFGFAAGDTDFDGDYDGTDSSAISGWSGAGKPYRAYADVNLDGAVNSTDSGLPPPSNTLGRGVLSHSSNGNRLGYAGYVQDGDLLLLYHVRFRVLNTETGRWLQRDPAGYVDGAGLYAYAASRPVVGVDPMGLDMTIGLPCMACNLHPGTDPPHAECPPGFRYDPILNQCVIGERNPNECAVSTPWRQNCMRCCHDSPEASDPMWLGECMNACELMPRNYHCEDYLPLPNPGSIQECVGKRSRIECDGCCDNYRHRYEDWCGARARYEHCMCVQQHQFTPENLPACITVVEERFNSCMEGAVRLEGLCHEACQQLPDWFAQAPSQGHPRAITAMQ